MIRTRSGAWVLLVATMSAGGVHAQTPDARPPAPAVATDAAIARIQTLLEHRDLSGAQAATDAALQSYPGDPALHNLAGVIAAERGAFADAVSQFTRAIALAPSQTAAYENLGRLYQERAGTDPSARTKALEIYQRLLAVDPHDAEGLYQAGFLLALDGRFRESAALIARLPSDARERPQVLAVSVVDRAGLGDRSGAAAAAARLAAHPDLTAADIVAVLPAFARLKGGGLERQLLEALDRRSLATPGVLHRLGQLDIEEQKLADARQVLERALASGAPAVPVLVDLARAADKQGQHEAALGYLGHARTLDPNDATVHFLFGVVCVEMDLAAEAYESLKKAVALQPDSPPVNYMMGVVAMHRHDPSEALPYLQKYVRLRPEDPRGRFALGMGRFYANDFDGARSDLARVADKPATAAGACYFLARIARQSNDLASARRYIDRSIAANGSFADAWAELGLLQTRAGEYAAAERSLRKALAIDADNYPATVNLTALYNRTRDPRQAEQAAKLAALQQKRDERAQDFLRTVEVVPQ